MLLNCILTLDVDFSTGNILSINQLNNYGHIDLKKLMCHKSTANEDVIVTKTGRLTRHLSR